MVLDVSKLKSARVVEDPAEIGKLIARSRTKSEDFGSYEYETVDDDNPFPVSRKFNTFKADESSPPVPDAAGIKQLVEARGMPWDPELADRVVPYFASDERVDADGDILRQNWIFDDFEKNSPMPYSHRWGDPPIGRVIDWDVIQRNSVDYVGPALHLLGMFSKEWEWADNIFRLVKSGFLPGGSVGFWSSKIIHIEDDEERAKIGLGRWGVIFEESHLLEFSPTTIPANPGVTSLLAATHKSLKSRDVHMIRELQRQQVCRGHHDSTKFRNLDYSLVLMAKALWPEEKWEVHKELDTPVLLGLDNPEVEDEEIVNNALLTQLVKSFDEFRSEQDTKMNDIREHVESLTSTIERMSTPPVQKSEKPAVVSSWANQLDIAMEGKM